MARFSKSTRGLRVVSKSLVLLLAPVAIVTAQHRVAVAQSSTAPSRAYIDDQDQRPLADMTFQADPEKHNALQLEISAIGPSVEPIAGYRGIRGANRYTAEELELTLQGYRDATIRTTYPDGTVIRGTIQNGRRGFLVERRLMSNGRIDFLHLTPRQYPLSMLVNADAARSGRRTTEVIVDGQVRFRVTYDVKHQQVQLLDFQSVGSDHYLARRQSLQSRTASLRRVGRHVFTVFRPDETPPASIDVWDKCDIEARWVMFSKSVDDNPEKMKEWLRFLIEREEYELLEWIAIYRIDAFKGGGVGDILLDQKAPQWLRVAVWHVTSPFSTGHSRQIANDLVVNHQPGLARDWLTRHQSEIENWKNGVDGCLSALEQSNAISLDSTHLSKPLKSDEVFKHLDAPKEVQVFGTARTARPGVVYEHQVIRAINGITVGGRFDAKWTDKIRALTKHSNLKVRQGALLAFSYFGSRFPGTETFEDFRRTIADASEPAMIREAALMAYSYHRHPNVILTLHNIATNPDHPAWKAAVSRLGDLGKPFSGKLLSKLDATSLSEQNAKVLSATIQRLVKRYAKSSKVSTNRAIGALQLAAYAAITNDQHSEIIKKWAFDSVRSMPDKSYNSLVNLKPTPPNYWLPVDREVFDSEFMKLYDEIVK